MTHLSSERERIVFSAVNGGFLTVGQLVEVTTLVYAYSSTVNFVESYITDDPSDPNWQFINTLKLAGTGLQYMKAQFILGGTSLQTDKVVIWYNMESPKKGKFFHVSFCLVR
jgi:hypothetical protein